MPPSSTSACDRDGVVGLHERVEELGDGDGRLRCEALGEVVALEQARDGRRTRQAEHFGEVELPEPLAVEAHLETGGISVDHERCLLEVPLRVAVDLLVGEHRALGRPPGRIADSRRVVADDEHPDVTRVLEGPHPLERDRVADVHVGRGDVDAELDAQCPAERELALELALREDVHRVAGEVLEL